MSRRGKWVPIDSRSAADRPMTADTLAASSLYVDIPSLFDEERIEEEPRSGPFVEGGHL